MHIRCCGKYALIFRQTAMFRGLDLVFFNGVMELYALHVARKRFSTMNDFWWSWNMSYAKTMIYLNMVLHGEHVLH